MLPAIMRWTLRVGLGSLLLLALPLLPLAVTNSSLVQAADKTEPLDLNSATVEQLRTLTGIGEAYSAKIIKGRPYKRRDELVQRKILPQATYDKIKDQIVAKQQ